MLDKRLLHLLEKSKKYMYQTVFLNWIALLVNIGIMVLLTTVLANLRMMASWNRELTYYIVGSVVLIILRSQIQRQTVMTAYKASGDIKQTLREKIYSKIMRLGVSYHEKVSTAQIIQVSTEGVEQLEIYFGKYLPQLFYSLLAPLTLFFVILFVNVKVAVVLFICVPLIPISIMGVQKIAKKLLAKYWGSYTDLGDSFLENLQGLTTLKIYQADEKKTKEMDEQAEGFRKATMKVLIMQLNSISVMDIVAFGGAALGIGMALLEYHNQNISFSGMLLIVLLASEFFIPMRLLGSFFHIAMNGAAASEKMFQIFALEEVEEGNIQLDTLGSIHIQNLHFAYKENEDVLKNINITIEEGKFTALVGASGCGKSTVAKLLAGQNKGYQGSITFGEKELSKISERELLKKNTLLSHNSYVFTSTIEENLRMARPQATDGELIEMLELVGLLDVLQKREGLQMNLAEQGADLSGGQRQRLGFARALLHNTPMYIFDEATSNIDVESEEKLMATIQAIRGLKTILMISHRLENVKTADVIYYMEVGEVKEQGTHEELMQLGGGYKAMYCKQRRLEEIREANTYA